MLARGIVFATGASLLGFGCVAAPDDTSEIVDNLMRAGFPASQIMVVDSIVYVGRDAQVSLAASREMVAPVGPGKEQYRTTNLVSTSLTKICVDGSTFTGDFSTALDLAIQNYDEQPLTFAMARTPSAGCSFTITAVIDPVLDGGEAGFPEGGLPFDRIKIGATLSTFGVDTLEHVITHELGHTIGFRHSDYFNPTISCNQGANEGDGGVGAIHIPGSPTGATVGGSIMNACFRDVETGEFTASDLVALKALYEAQSGLAPRANSDFDADTRADFAVWRPTEGNWYVIRSTEGIVVQPWGLPGDIPVTGDFDGDRRADLAVWRPIEGIWYVVRSSNGSTFAQPWGLPGDIPVPADFDGDGRTDLAVWRPIEGIWYVVRSSNGGIVVQNWGLPGDVPTPGDFDGDGRTDFAVWRPSEGNWYVIRSSSPTTFVRNWGISGDVPVAGDFDGDARTDLAVWRPIEGTWYVMRSTGGTVVQPWGLPGDIPCVADFDGDGRTEFTVWRPGNGTWFVIRSSNGSVVTQPWGTAGDIPASRPVRS
jgi:hypothetical protein